MARASTPYRLLAVASAVVFLGAVAAGVYQSFLTSGRPPSLSISPAALAAGLLQQGDYGTASREFETALRLDPERRDRAPLLAVYGQSLAGLGRNEEAVTRYREALAAGFDRPDLRLMLASALTALGRFDEAIPEYRLGLVGGDNARARNNLGYVLERSGDRAAAIEEYRRAATLSPDLVDAHLNLGRALVAEGRGEEAIAPLEKAARLSPSDPRAIESLANAYRKLGRFDEAAASYRKALEMAPDDTGLRDEVIASLLASGMDGDAIAVMRTAADSGSEDAALLNELAWRLATTPDPSLRSPEEAIRFSLRSLAITEDAFALDTLATAYAAAGRFDEAVATAERAAIEAQRRGNSALAAQIRARQQLFARGVAYLENGLR